MSVSIKAGSSIRLLSVPYKTRVVLLACGSAVLIVGVVARLWNTWRRCKRASGPHSDGLNERTLRRPLRGLNGDIPQLRSMPTPLCARCRLPYDVDKPPSSGITRGPGSLECLRSTRTMSEQSQFEETTPQQFGVIGMEALDIAIKHWDDAIAAFQSTPPGMTSARELIALPSNAEAEFVRQLQILMKQAFKLRDNCTKLFLDNASLVFYISDDKSSVAGGYSARAGDTDKFDARTVLSFDEESFVSAQGDIANLGDFEDLPNLEELQLFQNAQKMLKDEGVPARAVRTQLVLAQSDEDYLAKLHCIRLAFSFLGKKSGIREQFASAGSQIIAGLLMYAEKDPVTCVDAYDRLVEWSCDSANRPIMEQELRARGVSVLTVYDVVFDFLIVEAFEDLDEPPQSVVSVIQNRWLTAGFRETALSAAIWSVIRAKRSRVKVENGFFAHFYSVAETLIPVLAWGFLGTNPDLKETCHFFRQEILNFMQGLFDFRRVRYTTVEDLSEDILGLTQLTVERITQRLGV